MIIILIKIFLCHRHNLLIFCVYLTLSRCRDIARAYILVEEKNNELVNKYMPDNYK